MSAPTAPHREGQRLTAQEIESQLQEALVMAGMVSLRNDLSVEIGEWWAFNWTTNVITIPLQELLECPREEICWIILHEAAHAALTRLHHLVPEELQKEDAIAALLNCIEYVRIENWLVERFPGSRSWQRVAREMAAKNDSVSQEHPVRAFLRGVLRMTYQGNVFETLRTEARAALEEARPALELAFACVPPTTAAELGSVQDLYNQHAVSHCYRRADLMEDPPTFEKWVRVMQASMWAHVIKGVLSPFRRLVKQFGFPPLPWQRTILVTQVRRDTRSKRRSPSERRRALRASIDGGGQGQYLATVHKYGAEIKEVSDLLLQLLPNHRSLHQVRRCSSGDLLDLRTASQFEADRRLYSQLWIQRRRRVIPDPALLFLMDRSGSMRNDGKATAAYESLVLLREACLRVRIPFSILLFDNDTEVIHGWDSVDTPKSEAALAATLRPGGGTSLQNAFKAAEKHFESRTERDKFLFVMSDGKINRDEGREIRRQAVGITNQGIKLVPFGLGFEGEDIRTFFPEAELIRDASALPSAFSRALVASIQEASFT